jgi:hypothetical protein
LVPFSFVADWFVNFGDFIEALLPRSGTYPLASWYTVTREIETTRIITNTQYLGWTPQRLPVSRDRTFTRRVYRFPSLPPPALTWRTQSVKDLITDARGLDLLALFSNGFSRKAGRL